MLSPAVLAKQLENTANYLDLRAAFQHDWYEWFLKSQMGGDAGGSKIPGGPTLTSYDGHCYELDDDHVLLMEFDKPSARYWGVQLYDAIVYDCFDWLRNITSRNHTQIFVNAAGRVQLVVGHVDPGVEHWLDSAGNPDGIAQFRWIWSDDAPEVKIRKIPIGELKALLHPATPAYTPEQRSTELRMRQRKLAHHLFW